MTVDLDAIAANWRALKALAAGAECAAVVKADAYGLGLAPIAVRLSREGARTFFVATADEGETLRAILPSPPVYVLNGFQPGEAGRLAQSDLRPVLNSYAQFAEWKALASRPPAALQIDTGMQRTGFSEADLQLIADKAPDFGGVEIALLMSHLACADEPPHPKNGEQLARFRAVLERFPKRPASLAASAGALLGQRYLFDMIRPGIALYGGNPRASGPNPMRCAVTVTAPIVQLRRVDRGESVGYGASFTADGPSVLATAAIGYADGIMRSLSNTGEAQIGGFTARFAGRVSMDLTTLDVTGADDGTVTRGTLAEFLGPHVTLESVAARAGTANYEILTGLGPRLRRVYKGAEGI